MVSFKPQKNEKQLNNFSSTEWLTTQAVTKHKEGKLKEAIAFYLEAIELDSNQLAWVYGNAITLMAQTNRLDEGLKLGEKALIIHPESDEIYRAIAIVYEKQQDIFNCIEYYQKAIALKPIQPDWLYCNLAKQLLQNKQIASAIKVSNQGTQYYPNFHPLRHTLDQALVAQSKWDQAIAVYTHARQLDSESSFVLAELQEIATSLKKQIKLNPDVARNYFLLGEVYAQLARWDKAVFNYDQAYQLNFKSEDLDQKINYATEQKEKNQLGGIGDYLFCDLSSNNPFIARITDIELDGIIKGWAINNERPEQSLKLKIKVDNQEITTIETGDICGDITHDKLTHHPKKFQFQLPFLLNQKLLLNDELHLIEIVPISKPEEGLQPIVVELIVPRKSLGRVDTNNNNNLINGWALPDGHFGTASLDVYVDDLFYSRIEANLSRRDLVKYGLGNGKNGFEVEIPYSLTKNKLLKVDIFFSNTQHKLNKKPIILESINEESETDNRLLRSQLSRLSRDVATGEKGRGVTIIVPIFNAHDEVRACIESVVEQTTIAARLLLINDASTDERIPQLLKWAKTYSNVHVINNEQNLGYTKTINVGIKWAGNDDIVLLNSDTVVGSRWLQNLQVAAYHEPDIATVTAMSDNAGAFSVPTMGRANELPKWLTFEEFTRAIAHNCQNIYPEVPTGNGFCLYIRRAVFDRIGFFDEATFPRGYGEENDFCMRALRAGWRHIIDDRTLVRHVRSASFQGEKTSLYEAGGKAITKLYPAYKKLTKTFTTSPNLLKVRYKIRKLIEKGENIHKRVLPRVLYVISTQTGGTPQTNQDLMNGLSDQYHTFLLHCNSQKIVLYDTSCQPHLVCETIQLESPISAESYYSKEYDEAVSSILVRYGIELLHIRHILWHSLSLPRLAKQIGISVVFSFHDFYTICPTVNLLDENLVFCGGRCTETEGQCDVKLWDNNLPKLKHNFIKTWQQMMADMLQYADAFVTTSSSAKAQIEQIYPQLNQKPFSVIPHGRDFLQLEANTAIYEQFLHPSQPLRLLFSGNVGKHKGAELITQIEALDIEKRIEFHFLGNTDPMLRLIGKHYGAYKREDYHKWIRKIQPHYVGLFSIWPETYCHTLTESWASGVPVIALDMGAVGDRIRHHGGGWMIDTLDPEAIYTRLLEIADDLDGYLQKISEIRCWQRSYGKQNNIATMAAKYHELYQQVTTANRSFQLNSNAKQRTKLGVFIKTDRHQNSIPSSDIRILEWLRHPHIVKRLNPQFLNIDAFLQDEDTVFNLEVLLVRHDAIEPYLVKPFIAACQKRQLPFVVELDDYPINLLEDPDIDGFSSKTVNNLKTLLQAANLVMVSNKSLAEKISSLNNNLAIAPNTLSEFTWLRQIEPCSDLPVSLFEKKSDQFKILYLNNSDRAEELEMLRPVFEELQRKEHPVELFVISGEAEAEAELWYQHIAIPAKRKQYSQFVDWFRGVASYCDLAIAPLADTDINRYDSGFNFLQYSAVGLPTLCSNRPPYSNLVRQEVDGILVENATEAWHRAITFCLSNSDSLNSIGNTAKQEIINSHLMSERADYYCQLFEGLEAKRISRK